MSTFFIHTTPLRIVATACHIARLVMFWLLAAMSATDILILTNYYFISRFLELIARAVLVCFRSVSHGSWVYMLKAYMCCEHGKKWVMHLQGDGMEIESGNVGFDHLGSFSFGC